MKAAKFFSICEIVCFVGLALSYAGEFLCAFVAQGTDKDIFQMGLFLFCLLIGPLAICNLICAAVMYRRLSDPAVRQTLWRCIIAMKCIAIPMFLLNFFFGMIYGMFTLIFPMTLPVVLLQILVAWFAMMASSGYSLRSSCTRAGRAKSAPEPQSCRSFPSLFTLLMLSACFSFARR